MAAYTIDPTAVSASANAKRVQPNPISTQLEVDATGVSRITPTPLLAGETILAGQAVCRQVDNDGIILLASAKEHSADSECIGLAENSASTGQPVSVVYEDPEFKLGSGLLTGDVVITNENDGGLSEAANKMSGWDITIIGVAIDTETINLKLIRCGASIA